MIIDEYSRYPVVEFTTSTSAKYVLPIIDKVFATLGFPQKVKTDGGPPFNGTDSHEYKVYMKWAGIKARVVSPEDPKANGLAENFMKVINKIWHISKIEGKNPKQEINKFLRQYRATPHYSTTGKSSSSLMFNFSCRTRLLELKQPALQHDIRQQNEKAKRQQKMYKDNKRNVCHHNIDLGDKVLLLQKKTKSQPQYNPTPYQVTKVRGTQITAARGDEIKTRDAQKFKKVQLQANNNYGELRNTLQLHQPDLEFSFDPPISTRPASPTVLPSATRPVTPPIPTPPQTISATATPATIRTPINPTDTPASKQQNLISQSTQPKFYYSNGQLDPNIDINIARGDRQRKQPERYEA